ncbi:unnamed protein product [Cuscuta epithymum]|uniref:Thiaminase-2/PQQC domain-containing protein n=1 Tax=Cuscuta epithymum TaxID=186058 RepID=A0AAV0D4V8_9ASTE|nr:unnamed protein product [Cuscuta epithymum]
MAILWALESVYHDSFANCLGDENSHTPENMKEVCRKWGNDAFGDYCVSLQSAADRALEKASPDAIAKAEVTLLQFLEIVVEFWNVNMKTMQPNAA